MTKYGRKNFEPVSTTQSPRMGDLTVGDYANGMPNIRLGEMFKSFMRQLFWIAPLFVVGFFVAGWATKDLKRTYTGDGRIMVQLGEEYVYNPIGQTGSGNGLSTTIDTITLTEAGLMKNSKIVQRVLDEIAPPLNPNGANRTNSPAQNKFDREAFNKINQAKNERDRQDAIMELRASVEANYAVMPRPKSSLIDVRFTHIDPDIAVATTNAFIDNYMSFRREIFVEGSSELIGERREATEEQLNSNERAIAKFLKKNGISDFASEQTGLQKRTEDLKSSLNVTRASMAETEAALAQVEDQLRGTPDTIDLFRDDRASQRVAQAELELRQLLAKYLPTSDPVRQKQTELNELKGLLSSYGGKASGGRRVGPNPTHQGLTAQRNTLAASADSLREREFTQQRQLNTADQKIRKLTSLSPEHANLLRERETLKTRLTSYNSKEQEALVDAVQAEDQAENVTEISRAQYASKGRNMRKLAWFGATAAWGIVLFFLAMIRVFLDPRLYAVPDAVQAVSVQQAEVDMMPAHNPIPEAVPHYEPPQPYAPPLPDEAQPAAAYAEPEPYVQTGYTDYNQPAYDDPYAVQANAAPYHAQYGQVDPAPAVYAENAPAAYADLAPAAYADLAPAAYAENMAVDVSNNPYASGQIQAGNLSGTSPYAPPQS